jgi:tRNA (mo5U34)-methyltransferase
VGERVIRAMAIPEDLRRRVDALSWWHTIELAPGLTTPGRQGPGTEHTLRRLRLPERLDGKTFLDIGAWDGAFSFEAERRGAARVLATDWFAWHSPDAWSDKRGFELARETLGSTVEDLSIDVPDIGPERVGTFDVVLLSGVLYHVPDPLACLQRAASVTRELLIVETHVHQRPFDMRPRMLFLRPELLDEDPTNIWAPNKRCVLEMLRYVGFRDVRAFGDVPGPRYGAARGGAENAVAIGSSWRDWLWRLRHPSRRMVFHARRS